MEDRCVICGEIIPEGRQVCPTCERAAGQTVYIWLKNALEKQIPKKPRKMVFGFVKESYDYSCPTCGNRIISKIDGEWCAGAKYKFCVNCGQSIDWSDENEH